MSRANLAIVIPAYNEYNRFPSDEYRLFLQNNPRAALCFVNDASTDKTNEVLVSLHASFPEQIFILTNTKNSGKAFSVRRGVLHCHDNSLAPAIAYLDADLATSLEECYSYLAFLDQKDFVFASRILKIGSVVDRRFSRFLIGRTLATAISNILDLKVYDTQCGCKVFKDDLSAVLFGSPFISKWLFDVELFSRMLVHYGKEEAIKRMDEIPVKRWVDRGESKVKISYFFRLWYDLLLIYRQHKKSMKMRRPASL